MDEKYLNEIVIFSEAHPWKPQWPRSLVIRFLTELISSRDLIFEIRDQSGLVAVAVLLDKVNNIANDACLEILGLSENAEASEIFKKFTSLAKQKTPPNRAGFQVALSPNATVPSELVKELGLIHYYDTYEMQRLNLADLPQSSRPEIVDATPDDRDLIYKILGESFAQNPETSIPDAETWKQGFLKSPKSHFYLWQESQQPLGFAALTEEDGGKTEVRNIGVLPTARGKGIGECLLMHCLQMSVKLGHQGCQLTVAVENQKALGLYLRAGFEVTEKNHCYRIALR